MIRLLGYGCFFLFSTYAIGDVCQKIDLSEKDNVLHPLTASHQNGLGICHVEQLQRMLKAKLPNHPELARVSLAMAEKKARDKNVQNKKAVRWKNSNGSVGGFYFDAGNSCEAFNLLKGQSICEAQYDQLENLTKLQPNDQHKILNALSIFFDDKSKSLFAFNPQGQVLQDLALEYNRAVLFCPLSKDAEDNFLEQYNSHVGAEKALASVPSFNAHEYLSKSTKGYLAGVYPGVFKVKNPSAQFKLSQRALEDAYKQQEFCAEQNIMTLKNPLCPIFNPEFAGIFSLKNLGFNYKDFYRMLSLVDKDRDKYFEDVFHCSRKKVKIPSTLNCSTENLNAWLKGSESDDEYVKKFTDFVSKNLEGNTPLGISVCTRFFKKPSLKTYDGNKNFTCGKKDDPSYQAGEGSHAVTIIGKRCVNGETEFLVHNSWGKGCGYYDKSMECNKNGGFWVNSKILSMNSRNLNILK